jgi:histone-lysine N-methyltransferase SETMAR
MINQAYGKETLVRSAVFKWHKRFAQGRDSLEDNEHTGLLRTFRTELNIQEVATLVHASRSKTVDEIAAAAGISHGTCHIILSDGLNMSRVIQHSVPRVLMQDKRYDRMSICGDLIDNADKDGTFLSQIIIGDETWRFLYDPQLKRQSAAWKSPSSPRKKNPRQDRSKGKVMVELFFDSFGIVHMEFILKGATVNKHRYKEIFRRVRNSVHNKHPELWRRKNWLLLYDGALAHRYVLVQEELVKQQVTVLPRPPYSPDLAPCDFFFFSRWKEKLRGCRFQSAEEIVTATREAVRDLSANIF